jgi:protein-L-isoaspartate(D-aspartate) O-methyltransferase
MDEERYRALRERMVAEQIEPQGITDARILAAMRRVPRHRFVPADQAPYAYDNRALPLPHGQTISQPLMVAVMLQAAGVRTTDNVLEVGAGSGYQAALLAELAGRVTTLERLPELAESSASTLQALGYESVRVVHVDGSTGYPPLAPYDRILVAAGAPRVPDPLVEQLAPNGRMVLPVGSIREQTLWIVDKGTDGTVSSRSEGWCAFVPLIGTVAWPGSPQSSVS